MGGAVGAAGRRCRLVGMFDGYGRHTDRNCTGRTHCDTDATGAFTHAISHLNTCFQVYPNAC